jgi:hypothetical protein
MQTPPSGQETPVHREEGHMSLWQRSRRYCTRSGQAGRWWAVPYKIHTVLTDNGIQFAEQPRNRNTIYSRPKCFDMICAANTIKHRLTKPNHP